MKLNIINNLSKMKNKKIAKRVIIGGCALALVSTLASCKEYKTEINSKTFLGNRVITFNDGTKDVAEIFEHCNKGNHDHYKSLITGELYNGDNCNFDVLENHRLYHYDIKSDESIAKYMTTDELNNLMNGEISKEDLNTIVLRIQNITQEESTTKKYVK